MTEVTASAPATFTDALPWLLAILGLICSGFIGAWIAGARRRSPGEGFRLGLLGPIGWIVEGLLPTDSIQPRRKCPHCAEMILSEAKACPLCGRDVEPMRAGAAARRGGMFENSQVR